MAVEKHDLGNRVFELNGFESTAQAYYVPGVLLAAGVPAPGLICLNGNKARADETEEYALGWNKRIPRGRALMCGLRKHGRCSAPDCIEGERFLKGVTTRREGQVSDGVHDEIPQRVIWAGLPEDPPSRRAQGASGRLPGRGINGRDPRLRGEAPFMPRKPGSSHLRPSTA